MSKSLCLKVFAAPLGSPTKIAWHRYQHPEKFVFFIVIKYTYEKWVASFFFSDAKVRFRFSPYFTGYRFWVWHLDCESGRDKLLFAHELIHVKETGGRSWDEAFTKQYLLQLAVFGYGEAPINLEAYNNAPSTCNSTQYTRFCWAVYQEAFSLF